MPQWVIDYILALHDRGPLLSAAHRSAHPGRQCLERCRGQLRRKAAHNGSSEWIVAITARFFPFIGVQLRYAEITSRLLFQSRSEPTDFRDRSWSLDAK